MECVSVSTELLYPQRKRVIPVRSEYHVDFWREVKKRWLVFGVLVSVMFAVISPRIGAPGGPLHTEYLTYIPLSFIYYKAGHSARLQRVTIANNYRLLVLSAIHAHLVASALCIMTVEAFKDVWIDSRVIKGAILSSVGGPCAWLSLSMTRNHVAPLVTAFIYATSVVAAPLMMIVLCGRATIQPFGGILSTVVTTVTPFTLGAIRSRNETTESKTSNSSTTSKSNTTTPKSNTTTPKWTTTATKLTALLLLYADCCKRLYDAEGSLYVGDVLITLVLELSWLLSSAAVCWLYARCGVISAQDSHTLALCSIPKCFDVSWSSSTACMPIGLSRLPAVFAAPTQALLLAALVDHDVESVTDDDGLPQ